MPTTVQLGTRQEPDEAGPVRTHTSHGGLSERLPRLVHVLGLAGAAALLLSCARGLWFFGDDWAYLLDRNLSTDTFDQLMRPHNEHWTLIPILLFRTLFGLQGIHHYLPYASMVIAAHIGVCLLVHSLLHRANMGRWVPVGASLVIAFLGGGAENTLWDFQITFVGSVFFGLAALRCIDSEQISRRQGVLASIMLLCSLMCSGIGIPMVITCLIYLVGRQGIRQALQVTAAPIIGYLIWYGTYGKDAPPPPGPKPDYLQVPAYAWTGLTNIWQTNTGIPTSGALLFALLVGVAVLGRQASAAQVLAYAGLGGAVFQYTLSAFGRVQLGIVQSTGGRYLYVGSVLMIFAVALAVRQLRDFSGARSAPATVAFIVCFVFVITNGVEQTKIGRHSRALLVGSTPQQILGAAQLVREHAPLLEQYPEPIYDPNITVARLSESDVQAALPKVKVGEQGLLDAAVNLQVNSSNEPPSLDMARSYDVAGMTVISGASSCTMYEATVTNSVIEISPTPHGSYVSVQSSSTAYGVYLLRGSLTSIPRNLKTAPGQVSYLATSAVDARLKIVLNASGRVVICAHNVVK